MVVTAASPAVHRLRRRSPFPGAAALLVAALLGSPVAADPPGGAAFRADAGALPGGGLAMEPRLTLAAIHPRELSESASVAFSGGAAPLSSAFAGFDAPLPRREPELRTVVEREIPELWQLRISSEAVPELLDVRYDVVSARGRPDRLSHREAESEIRVRVVPIRPRVVRRDGDGAIVEGGVVLELDVAAARVAGTYLGTITATVENL